MEKKRRIIVRFTGHRERGKTASHLDELFVLCGQTELVYPLERVLSSEEPDWPAILEREYMVHVVRIIPEERRVILGDKIATKREGKPARSLMRSLQKMRLCSYVEILLGSRKTAEKKLPDTQRTSTLKASVFWE